MFSTAPAPAIADSVPDDEPTGIVLDVPVEQPRAGSTAESDSEAAAAATSQTEVSTDAAQVPLEDFLDEGSADHTSSRLAAFGRILSITATMVAVPRCFASPARLQRFSVLASTMLGLVGAGGLVMAAIILDAPSELWSTSWGQVLVVKVVFVAGAGAIGLYNHLVMIPALGDEDDGVSEGFRRIVTAEAGLLLAASVVTALLVGAATSAT